MNQGVEILLSRMDSNPEEFSNTWGNKWNWVVEGVHNRIVGKDKTSLAYLKDDEVQALFDKLQELSRDKFTKQVMATLLQEEDEGSLYSLGHKPSKILTTATLKDQALTLLESEIPKIDLNEAALEQLMLDLNTYEKAKKRRTK